MIVPQKSTGLLDRQHPPETRDKLAASGPGEVEPGEPTRPLYDDHLAIVDRRTSGPGSVVSGVKVTSPAGHRPPQPRKAEPAIGLRSRMVSLHPRVFLHSVRGTTPRCVAINFGWTPRIERTTAALRPLHRGGPARHPFLWGLRRGGGSTDCSHQRHYKAEDRAHTFSTIRFRGWHADPRWALS